MVFKPLGPGAKLGKPTACKRWSRSGSEGRQMLHPLDQKWYAESLSAHLKKSSSQNIHHLRAEAPPYRTNRYAEAPAGGRVHGFLEGVEKGAAATGERGRGGNAEGN